MQDRKSTSVAIGPRAGPLSTAMTNTVTTRGHVESLRLRLQASAMLDTAPDGQGLEDYICKGPLLAPAGVSAAQVHDSLSTWQELAVCLIEQLGFDAGNLSASERERIYHYYLPLYFWIDAQFQAHAAQQPDGKRQSMVVGISAPQGCGKTTVVESLQHLLTQSGRRVASVSIDDFYLTRAEQVQLAESLPQNDILQSRGNAGTHDLPLGASVLQKLRTLRDGESCALPRYDKAAHAGQGDRAPESQWPVVQGPIDIVLFEGWMLGFAPVSSAAAANVDPSLEPVNESLKEYEAAWDAAVDSWIVIRVGSPEWVHKWRLQAEVAMRASGKLGMSDEQIAAFVNRYMPAYKAYLPGLYSKGPTTCQPGRLLVVEVDANRSPVPDQPSAIC